MPESRTYLRLVDLVRERVAAELNARKDRAGRALADLAVTVRRVGEPLGEDPPLETLGGYVDQAAAGLERAARGLRERDVSELADELRRMARRRPAAFAAAGFAVGLVAARFWKSSSAELAAGAREPRRVRPSRAADESGRTRRARQPAGAARGARSRRPGR